MLWRYRSHHEIDFYETYIWAGEIKEIQYILLLLYIMCVLSVCCLTILSRYWLRGIELPSMVWSMVLNLKFYAEVHHGFTWWPIKLSACSVFRFLDGSSKRMNKIIFSHVFISKQQKISIGDRAEWSGKILFRIRATTTCTKGQDIQCHIIFRKKSTFLVVKMWDTFYCHSAFIQITFVICQG